MTPRPKIKLAYVLARTQLAGAERQVLHHLRRLDPNRYEPVVISLAEPGELSVKIQHSGTPVLTPSFPKNAGLGGRIAAFIRLVKLLRDVKADIVHVASHEGIVPAVLAARTAGVPIILATWRRHVSSVSRWQRYAAHRTDRILVPSAELATDARDLLGVGVARLRLLPPIVDPSELFGKDRPAGFDEPVFRVASMMRLDASKGGDDLLEAALVLKRAGREIQWFVAGTSSDPVPFLRRVQRAGMENEFHLLGERGDRGSLLSAMDVYVQPSREDGLPVALLEAMVAGVPAVATSNPSVEAALRGSGARLVPASNPEALAAAIVATLDDPMEERARRQQESRRVAGPLTRVEPSVVTLHEIYDEVVAEALQRRR